MAQGLSGSGQTPPECISDHVEIMPSAHSAKTPNHDQCWAPGREYLLVGIRPCRPPRPPAHRHTRAGARATRAAGIHWSQCLCSVLCWILTPAAAGHTLHSNPSSSYCPNYVANVATDGAARLKVTKNAAASHQFLSPRGQHQPPWGVSGGAY